MDGDHDKSEDGSLPFSLSDVWAIFQMQRNVILAVTLLVLVVGTVYTLLTPKLYRATASIRVSPFVGQEMKVDDVVDAESAYIWNVDGFMKTQVEVLKSSSLREEVVRRYQGLGYDDLKIDDGGADALGGMLSIGIRSTSEIVDVSVTHEDPEKAAILANLVAEVYREQNLDSRRDGARESKAWLQDQLVDYQKRIDTATQALLTFQREHQMGDADEQITQLSATIDALNQSYAQAQTQRIQQEVRVRQHEKLLASGEIESLAKDLNTSVLDALEGDYAGALADNAKLKARYGEKHPDVQYSESQLERLRSALEAEVKRTIAAEKAQLDTMTATEKQLDDEIATSKQQLLENKSLKEQYSKLQTELDDDRDFYQQLRHRNDELNIAAQTQLNNVRLVDKARPNYGPVRPRVSFNVGLSLFLGLCGGLAVGLLREYLDDTVSSPLDVATYLRTTYLGMIPRLPGHVGDTDQALYTHHHPDSNAAEAVRALRTVLEMNPGGTTLKRLLVTSSVAAEGKTSTTVRLGVAFANLGKRVLLVDADLRRPRLHKVFGTPKDIGVTSVIVDGVPLDEAIKPTEIPNLSFMASGPSAERPNELLASVAIDRLLDELDARYDLVIVDSPPSVMLSDAAILSKRVDGVLVVVREHSTSRLLVREALQRMEQVGATVLGVVVNAVDLTARSATYKYYYGYKYRYDRYYREAPPPTGKAAK